MRDNKAEAKWHTRRENNNLLDQVVLVDKDFSPPIQRYFSAQLSNCHKSNFYFGRVLFSIVASSCFLKANSSLSRHYFLQTNSSLTRRTPHFPTSIFLLTSFLKSKFFNDSLSILQDARRHAQKNSCLLSLQRMISYVVSLELHINEL